MSRRSKTMYSSYWPAAGTSSTEPATMAGETPSSVVIAADCQYCGCGPPATWLRNSAEITPLRMSGLKLFCSTTPVL